MSDAIEILKLQQEELKKRQLILKKEREKQEKIEQQQINPKKHIFVTMMTDDSYIQGVQALHYSLDKHINSKIKSHNQRLNKDLDEYGDEEEYLDFES